MDRIDRYKQAIHTLLEDYRTLYYDATDSCVDLEIVADDEHGQYMVTSVGWRGDTRVSRLLFYLRLKNGKIWIEEDWTKHGIASELVHMDVPHSDIVLAFNPPEVRHMTDYAVA